ncbi:M16 family metallopeptidase [Dongia sp.]|uniref:M16 family metallopeptidase n=1 Tax=Dongia sp. TaxID=1977262 RepID=UPI0035B0A471
MMRLATFLLAALVFAAAPARAAEIQRVVSPGGIEAWLIEDDAVPIFSLAFGFRGGSALDPKGKEGLAQLASGLFDEGAGELDSAAFQQRLAELGMDFSFNAASDDFSGRLRVLTEHAEPAIDLLALALTQPRFDAEPVERIRRQLLIAIESENRSPDAVASRVLNKQVLGDDPYARPDYGTQASMSALGAEDLKGFVRDRLTRDRLFVAAAGDIDPKTLGLLLDRAFGALPKTGPSIALAEVTPNETGSVLVVERDIPQASIIFAQPGLKRDDPDFFAAYLMNYTLGGGGFSSRLMTELREKRGLTYGVSTDLVTLDRVGLITGHFETGNDKVAETLKILRAEWQRMAREGPTEAELASAKDYLLGYYPRNLTTTSRTADTLLGIQMADLGIDYMERRQAEIAAVTLEDVRRVAGRLLDDSALSIVIAGQPVGVEGSVPATLP